MRLTFVHSRLFRNIVDSGPIAIEPDVTCLVGQNESGKTALLVGAYRFNPVYRDTFNREQDYPRWRLIPDRKSGATESAQPISCTFELDDEDLQAVADVLGPDVVATRAYSRSVSYAGDVSASIDVDGPRSVANLLDAAGVNQGLLAELSAATDLGNLVELTGGVSVSEGSGFTQEDVAAVEAAARARLAGKETTSARVLEILRDREPRFFYFSEYQGLPGRIDIQQLAGDEQAGASSAQTARALLRLADTTAQALTGEDFENVQAELEAVSNELTRQVLEFWTQNPNLSVQIAVDKRTEAVPNGQQAVARFLDVRVKDSRHGFTNNFSARSSGFQWFFSFLAAFSEFEDYEHGIVVLLDEPALTLHGRAQADFLRFIEERLAPSAQVIYTTHSPFMVEPAKLHRVRIVEDKGPETGSVVTDEALTVSDASLFPLQAALGYDIAQSLFVGPDNLLVEGTSDFTYLTLLSEHLESLGRPHLDPRWRVLPAGGATNIPAFVALIGRALEVTVLIDGSPAGVAKLRNLADKGLLANSRVLLTDTFASINPSDVEDIFDPGDYLTLYNEAFGTSLELADLNGSDRIIRRIGRAIGQNFDEHGRPAEALLRGRDRLLPGLGDATLSRFEALFEAINATLTQP